MTTAKRPRLRWTRVPPKEWKGDVRALAEELARVLPDRVGFDAGSRGLYATDASNYRQPPLGVVWPASAGDVERAVEVCRRHDAPILGRGGGTSLAGQCTNLAVVLDFSRSMHRIVEIDVDRRRARVEPGLVLDRLRAETTPIGLTYGPDPATHSHCTFGGMIGNDSCGVHSVMAGRTSDNVEELEVLTYDGTRMRVGRVEDGDLEGDGRRAEILRGLRDLRDRRGDLVRERFPAIPRLVSGYRLEALLPENGFHVARSLVGTEGTCAIVLEATVRLIEWPAHRVLLVIAYHDVFRAADHVPAILEAGPIGLEGLDDVLIGDQRRKRMNPLGRDLLPEGAGWLLAEFGGPTRDEAARKAWSVARRVQWRPHVRGVRVLEEPGEQAEVWEVRESGLGATARIPGRADAWPGWEDSAVPPERMGDYLRDLRELLDRYGYHGAFYGHFGQGCLHSRIDFDLKTKQGLEAYRAFLDEAADLVVSYGGSLSGEHGDGQSRAELLPKMYGDEICQAFREFKRLWDPDGRMNPGKVVDPYPILSNLRLGNRYEPAELPTRFQYPDDDHSFGRAVLRCVGVGKCRREGGGTMCPSYMVTRDEKHSTRGRARLLFEMLQGEVIRDGWKSEAVKDALDLCLSCKGCKSDCPVGVDMATYKAEFLSHHYEGRLRPRAAYAMGWIRRWAGLASRVPRLANLVGHAPLLSAAVKFVGGIAPQRDLPRFATRTFRARFEGRSGDGDREGRRVIFWPDTFNDFFDPGIAEAAVRVLEGCGFRVELPPAGLCCGRPLYDFGMLDQAKARLAEILAAMREPIEEGIPIVGIEPSCVATFRDELPDLFPHDEDARRLTSQTWLLPEFLEREAPGVEFGSLGRRALVHGHCHHKAVLGFESEVALLDRLGLDHEVLDSGCCGMAGAFGFEREKYDVSIRCGERVLLPAVRAAGPETLIVADGFSCREQIRQGTGRRALHLAEVLDQALAARR